MNEFLVWVAAEPGAIIATFALVVSISTFFVTRRRDRRDLFLKIHERQLDPDLQEGRRLLYQSFNGDVIPDFDAMRDGDFDTYSKINRALAMLHTMGLYAEKRYVQKALVLDEWADSLARLAPYARVFIQHRSAAGRPAWPHLRKLLAAAEKRIKKST